jgi:hypothetical protein
MPPDGEGKGRLEKWKLDSLDQPAVGDLTAKVHQTNSADEEELGKVIYPL